MDTQKTLHTVLSELNRFQAEISQSGRIKLIDDVPWSPTFVLIFEDDAGRPRCIFLGLDHEMAMAAEGKIQQWRQELFHGQRSFGRDVETRPPGQQEADLTALTDRRYSIMSP